MSDNEITAIDVIDAIRLIDGAERSDRINDTVASGMFFQDAKDRAELVLELYVGRQIEDAISEHKRTSDPDYNPMDE